VAAAWARDVVAVAKVHFPWEELRLTVLSFLTEFIVAKIIFVNFENSG